MRSVARLMLAVSASAALLLGAAVARAQATDAAQAAGAGQSAGERGLAAGDCRMAAEGFAADARSSRDPALAYRATEIAKACEHIAWNDVYRNGIVCRRCFIILYRSDIS